MFTNESLHKIYKQKLSLLSKSVLIVLILDDENNYYIFKTKDFTIQQQNE